jgi:virulence factor Mce-like protein
MMAGALLVAAAVVLLVVTTRSHPGGHRVSFVVASANDLIKGLKVRAAGQPVGHISSLETVDGGRSARVGLALTDPKAWPLARDTRLRLRYGGTVSYAARYVALEPGAAPGPRIPDGGAIATGNVEVPVEFDQVFNTYGPRTRHNLRATVGALGAALQPTAPQLRRTLGPAASAVDEARGLFGDLGDDNAALSTLVRSSDRVLDAANRASPGVAPLVNDAATTFSALASRTQAMRDALGRMPATLAAARSTLARADRTLGSASVLATRLRPGVERLIDITPPLNGTLRTLTAVAPGAVQTVATARRAAPTITAFVDEATALMPKVSKVTTQATTQLGCIRPYAPEIAGFASTWAGFVQNGDGKDKYARLFNAAYPFSNDTQYGVPQAAKIYPNAFKSYAFPRPPGANVNQPWFLPQCGITADGLDPQKNPEALANDPFSKNLVEENP